MWHVMPKSSRHERQTAVVTLDQSCKGRGLAIVRTSDERVLGTQMLLDQPRPALRQPVSKQAKLRKKITTGRFQEDGS